MPYPTEHPRVRIFLPGFWWAHISAQFDVGPTTHRTVPTHLFMEKKKNDYTRKYVDIHKWLQTNSSPAKRIFIKETWHYLVTSDSRAHQCAATRRCGIKFVMSSVWRGRFPARTIFSSRGWHLDFWHFPRSLSRTAKEMGVFGFSKPKRQSAKRKK